MPQWTAVILFTVHVGVLPGAVRVQGVEYGVLDSRVVDSQLRVDQHQIVT